MLIKTRYHVYIVAERNNEGKDAIKEYYCTYKNGARTVGCCAHIMAIIWYLGYAKYLSNDIQIHLSSIATTYLLYYTALMMSRLTNKMTSLEDQNYFRRGFKELNLFFP